MKKNKCFLGEKVMRKRESVRVQKEKAFGWFWMLKGTEQMHNKTKTDAQTRKPFEKFSLSHRCCPSNFVSFFSTKIRLLFLDTNIRRERGRENSEDKSINIYMRLIHM